MEYLAIGLAGGALGVGLFLLGLAFGHGSSCQTHSCRNEKRQSHTEPLIIDEAKTDVIDKTIEMVGGKYE